MYVTILLTQNNGGGGGVMPHKLKELYTEADGRNRNYSAPSVARHCKGGLHRLLRSSEREERKVGISAKQETS